MPFGNGSKFEKREAVARRAKRSDEGISAGFSLTGNTVSNMASAELFAASSRVISSQLTSEFPSKASASQVHANIAASATEKSQGGNKRPNDMQIKTSRSLPSSKQRFVAHSSGFGRSDSTHLRPPSASSAKSTASAPSKSHHSGANREDSSSSWRHIPQSRTLMMSSPDFGLQGAPVSTSNLAKVHEWKPAFPTATPGQADTLEAALQPLRSPFIPGVSPRGNFDAVIPVQSNQAPSPTPREACTPPVEPLQAPSTTPREFSTECGHSTFESGDRASKVYQTQQLPNPESILYKSGEQQVEAIEVQEPDQSAEQMQIAIDMLAEEGWSDPEDLFDAETDDLKIRLSKLKESQRFLNSQLSNELRMIERELEERQLGEWVVNQVDNQLLAPTHETIHSDEPQPAIESSSKLEVNKRATSDSKKQTSVDSTILTQGMPPAAPASTFNSISKPIAKPLKKEKRQQEVQRKLPIQKSIPDPAKQEPSSSSVDAPSPRKDIPLAPTFDFGSGGISFGTSSISNQWRTAKKGTKKKSAEGPKKPPRPKPLQRKSQPVIQPKVAKAKPKPDVSTASPALPAKTLPLKQLIAESSSPPQAPRGGPSILREVSEDARSPCVRPTTESLLSPDTEGIEDDTSREIHFDPGLGVESLDAQTHLAAGPKQDCRNMRNSLEDDDSSRGAKVAAHDSYAQSEVVFASQRDGVVQQQNAEHREDRMISEVIQGSGNPEVQGNLLENSTIDEVQQVEEVYSNENTAVQHQYSDEHSDRGEVQLNKTERLKSVPATVASGSEIELNVDTSVPVVCQCEDDDGNDSSDAVQVQAKFRAVEPEACILDSKGNQEASLSSGCTSPAQASIAPMEEASVLPVDIVPSAHVEDQVSGSSMVQNDFEFAKQSVSKTKSDEQQLEHHLQFIEDQELEPANDGFSPKQECLELHQRNRDQNDDIRLPTAITNTHEYDPSKLHAQNLVEEVVGIPANPRLQQDNDQSNAQIDTADSDTSRVIEVAAEAKNDMNSTEISGINHSKKPPTKQETLSKKQMDGMKRFAKSIGGLEGLFATLSTQSKGDFDPAVFVDRASKLLTSLNSLTESEQATSMCPNDNGPRMYRVVSTQRREVYEIIADSLENSGDWQESVFAKGVHTTSLFAWDLLWTWSKPKIDWDGLLVFQRINHFPNARELTRKDLLKKNIARYRNIPGRIGDFFDIMPITFALPHEYVQFATEFSRIREALGDRRNWWIMKPVGLSRGRGIYLINDIGQVHYGEPVVVQRYVMRPLLLEGYKFDLRLYVLVTSFKPLEAFLYRRGFARLSSEPYSTDQSTLENRFVHLTNSSVNKFNPTSHSDVTNDPKARGGSKVTLEFCWERLRQRGVDVDKLWESIKGVCLKTLYSVEDHVSPHPCSFELYGFDVLIDSDLKPWLIEVNSSPSLGRDNQLDHEIKDALVRDVFTLVDAPGFNRHALADTLKKRLQSKTKKSKFRQEDGIQSAIPDLQNILKGDAPRGYGTLPSKHKAGHFEMIAPSAQYEGIRAFHQNKK